MFKSDALARAIEVAKEFGRGGSILHPEDIIEETYNKIVEIAQKEGLIKEG